MTNTRKTERHNVSDGTDARKKFYRRSHIGLTAFTTLDLGPQLNCNIGRPTIYTHMDYYTIIAC